MCPGLEKTDLTATRYGQRVSFWIFCHRLSDLNSEGDLNKNSREMDSVAKLTNKAIYDEDKTLVKSTGFVKC